MYFKRLEVDEKGDMRFYITRWVEGGKKTERQRVRASVRVLIQYNALDTVLYKWPTWD